ncbi:hypothetical protein DFR67_102182 [Williamsia limnetica]|uniref:Uncharacterized protein n=2 Tax=Williamsia limnetica TaxID=882452 RepID=A0A318RN47_WILLI|nr:hypothetical protein DFR67_102182 [Williamsia limnetica]
MTENTDQSKTTVSPVVAPSKFSRVLSGFLNSPFAGMTPWIVMGFINGPGRFEEAAAVAFGLSLLFVLGGHKRGSKIKFLEVFDLVYFSSMVLLAQFAAASVVDWLELWGGEMTNIALVSFAFVSILIRQPFTMQYAKESEPEEMWDNPLFIHINYMITWSWVLGFGVGAIAGFYGDYVLNDNNNFWTGWIIGLAGTIFAISFTEFYPEYAVAKEMAKAGEDAVPQSLMRLLDWVPIFIIVTGVAGLVTDSTSTTLGVIIIVVGVVIKLGMRALSPDNKKA